MIKSLKPLIDKFMPFAQDKMGFYKPPKLFLRDDEQNAANPLGKTAFYDPQSMSITLFITGRHIKDVMRSLAHELIHHTQNCRGDFNGDDSTAAGYAQNNEHLRNMEKEAYEMGNICFRDWEDSIKNTIQYEHLQKGEQQMSIKDWKNKEIKSLLSESWGFKMDLNKLNEDIGGAGGEFTEKEGNIEEVEEMEECGEMPMMVAGDEMPDVDGEMGGEQSVPELVASVQAAMDALLVAVGAGEEEEMEPVLQEQEVRKIIRTALEEVAKRIKK